MRNVIFVLAAAACLAIGSVDSREVAADGPDPNKVVEQLVYDLGIVAVDKPDEETVDTDSVVAPEGKAEKLVVVGATWCGPCRSLKASTLPALKAQGYDVEYLDIDNDAEKLAEKYSNIKRVDGEPQKYNEFKGVPSIFYIRDGMIIKRETGYKTANHVKKTLWKEETSTVEKIRQRLPWNN